MGFICSLFGVHAGSEAEAANFLASPDLPFFLIGAHSRPFGSSFDKCGQATATP
jgi:hypothetical protein